MSRIVEKGVVVIIIFLLVVATIWSAIYDFKSFWAFSIGDFFTLLIAVVIGYYFVELKNGDRILNEKTIELIEKIENKILNTEYIKLDPQNNWKEILSNNRWLKNNIYFLERVAKKEKSIKKYVDKINEDFKSYESFVTENKNFKSEDYENPIVYEHQRKYVDDINFQLEQIKLKLLGIPDE